MTVPATRTAQAGPEPAGDRTLRRPATWLVVLSVALSLIAATTSLLGLFSDWPYAAEPASWRLQARGQDIGNLFAVVTLLAGLLSTARGSLLGFQVWVGSLLYLVYAFVLYAMTVHFGLLFLPYVAALGLSAYCLLFAVLGRRRRASVRPRTRLVGAGVIAAIAVLFGALWLSSIIPALLAGGVPPELAETGLVANPVHVLDLALVLPGMLITAGQAVRGRDAGALLLAPWLVFSALMGASVVASLLLAQAPAAPLVIVGLVTGASAAAATAVLRATDELGN